MRERFDIVVAGCGPAGATCAGRAAELGLSVVALERARFPRSKPCAAGLTEVALTLLGDDADLVAHDTVRRVTIELGRISVVWETDAPLLRTTTRKELDTLLVGRAVEAGARLEFGAAVSEMSLERDFVAVKAGGRVFSGRFLVGADGPRSAVGRLSGRPAQRLNGAAYLRVFPGTATELERFRGHVIFDPTVVRRGYGWVFPKRDHLNIGVFSQLPTGRWLIDDLRAFVTSMGVESWGLEGPYAASIPAGARGDAPGRGRVLLVGDAAGLADPITGEGISFAMASGCAAAEAVARSLNAPEVAAREYLSRLRSEVLPQLMRFSRVGNLMYPLGPRGMERVAEFPPARFALRRFMSLGRSAAGGGTVRVEPTQSHRDQQ